MKTIFQPRNCPFAGLALFLCALRSTAAAPCAARQIEIKLAEAAFPTVTDKLKPENPVKEPAASM